MTLMPKLGCYGNKSFPIDKKSPSNKGGTQAYKPEAILVLTAIIIYCVNYPGYLIALFASVAIIGNSKRMGLNAKYYIWVNVVTI